MTHSDDIGVQATAARWRDCSRDPVRVYELIKRDAGMELCAILAGFWGTIEEQVRLAALAGHNYNASQDDRVALLGLSQRAQVLATRYREGVEQSFERWRSAKPAYRVEAKSLSLMSEDELEMHLAGQQTAESLDRRFGHALELFDSRMQSLAAVLGVARHQPNPLRPDSVVAAFVGLFRADDLTPGLRALVFPLYEKRVIEVLGHVYTRLNAGLDAAGFGLAGAATWTPPSAHAPAPRPHGGDDAQSWVPEGGLVESLGAVGAAMRAVSALSPQRAPAPRSRAQAASKEGQPPRYRDVVREQLRTWRQRSLPAGRFSTSTSSTSTPSTSASPAGASWTGAAGDGEMSSAMAHGGVADGANAGGAFGSGSGSGRLLGTEDLLHVAQLLQGDDPTPYARALGGEGARPLAGVIRDEILGGVGQFGFDPADTHFSTDEEDAIDLIGILFQSLFEANDLLQRACTMYGRLVVPYLKVALTDDSMFNRRSHPARQLLDVLTEACDGNTGETAQDRETLERAERAVNRVVDEYEADQAIFELAAAELRDQLDQQRRRSELTEKRAAEAIHGRERLQHARRDAAALVGSRLADRPMTAAVAHFLDGHWRHYLTQTWLREGAQSPRHLSAIALGDAMVQTDLDAAQVRGASVARQLLALQVPLGECYACCGLDAGGARDAMARIIAALALPDTVRSVHLPQHDDGDAEHEDDARPTLQVVGGTDTLAFDPTIAARMRRLRVGQGLRLIDEAGRESAARIAWISPLTSRLLIVNRRGARKLVVSPEELAAMVASGQAVVRSVDAPFDEAMKQLWQRLNEPANQPINAPADTTPRNAARA